MRLPCGAVDKHSPEPAKARLVEAAKALIEILDKVDQYPALYLNRNVLRKAIFRYERCWIPLLATVPVTQRYNLVPPLDVEWVWFCHMLCPVQYIADSASMWTSVCPDEHGVVIDHKLMTGKRREEAVEKASRLWEEMFPNEPFHVLSMLTDVPVRENGSATDGDEEQNYALMNSLISYDIIAAAERQMAFHYQVALMPQYGDNRFLEFAVRRYYQFLQLKAQFPGEVWVPTCDIDVMWHAHMMHPNWYKEGTEKLLGSVLSYNDETNGRATGSELDARWNETAKKWMEMFHVPIIRGGGMWRGNVEADERIQRPYIIRLIESVTKKTEILLEERAAHEPRRMHKNLEFKVSYGGDVNWTDTKLGWVHMTDWRRSNRIGRASTSTENKVERVTFLRHSMRLILLTCRTIHFLMYDIEGNPYDFRTALEIFGNSPNIPVATAHNILLHTMCEVSSTASKFCKRKSGESVLLLRVGGKDFGLLGGSWKNFRLPQKRTESLPAKRGVKGGLELRLWFLGNKRVQPLATGKWQSRRGDSFGRTGRYSFTLPVLDGGKRIGEEKIEFDLMAATVQVRHPTHIIPAYLISMASAALHVTLQPRFMPKGGVSLNCIDSFYPDWSVPQHPSVMLQGAGGERKINTCNFGLWPVLYQNLSSHWHEQKFFSGKVEEIGAPFDAVTGGCGRCCGGVVKTI